MKLTRLLAGVGVLAAAAAVFLARGATARPRAKGDAPPLTTVAHVDLSRYTGTWYEIASIPQRFQRGCTATTATYTAQPDGTIAVRNACNLESLDGREKVARGRARVVDKQSNAKLEVSFFPFVWAPYWVIDLGKDYEYAVVGHPSRDYLWILSRTPTLDDDVYRGILARLSAQGYDVTRLSRTLQRVETSPRP